MRPNLSRTFRALRHRNFRLFFVGQGMSNMGTWLQQVAMGWLTYRLSGSAWLLGVVAFAANAGILTFGTWAGVLADRVQRRRALYLTQSLMLLQAVVLAVLTALGHIEVWHLIALALFLGVVSAFDIPVRQSLYVHLIEDRADLPNAIALNSLLVNAARVVGPALAGLLLAIVSEAVCFALNALSFAAVIIAVARMRFPHEPGPAAKASGWWSSWLEGFRYASRHPPARALLALVAALAWTITPYSSLMPIYAKDVYGGGPHTLGFLLAAAGAGALVSTAYLAGRESVRGLVRIIAIAAASCGAAIAAFAYLRVFPLALLLMVAAGAGVILAAASANTILQTIVDDRLRGRIAGFYTLAFLGVSPLGNLAAGALAERFGAPLTFALNGVIAMLAAAWFWRQRPSIRAALRPDYERLGIVEVAPPGR
ncbi:MAG: MFS transporter [Betaproteobacteria bacterium]